jgi:putative thioredoxin
LPVWCAATSRPAHSTKRGKPWRWFRAPNKATPQWRRRAAPPPPRAALELAEQAKTVGPIGELEQKVAANQLDHQARFDLALALNGKGRRLDALEHLLAIVKRDRKWNDDGARKQLVQFFDAWGPTDEATIEGRKRLSSVLFA